MGGRVLGIAQTMVTPPAKAAAVPEAKSSLCVPPGSRRCTWTSINPRRRGEIRVGVFTATDTRSQSRAPWAEEAHTRRDPRACTVCKSRQTVLRLSLPPQSLTHQAGALASGRSCSQRVLSKEGLGRSGLGPASGKRIRTDLREGWAALGAKLEPISPKSTLFLHPSC